MIHYAMYPTAIYFLKLTSMTYSQHSNAIYSKRLPYNIPLTSQLYLKSTNNAYS
jgi:hypothetical protein